MSRAPKLSLSLLCGTLALALAAPVAAGEGFGMLMTRKAAWLDRVSPPRVFITGTRIAVEVQGQGQKEDGAAERLESLLESELLNGDARLSADRARPQTRVDVKMLENAGSERWETRRETAIRQTGKDSKGKPVFDSVEVDVRYKIVSYRIGIAYKVRDTRTGADLDADSVTSTFKRDFPDGEGAPDLAALESDGMREVVAEVTRRLTPTRERIGVLLPKGSLERLLNLAQAGLWSKYLEAVEAMQPLSKPEDESYRQYALGLAYEALGYQAEDAPTSLRYLQQASVHYNSALTANPKEKYFSLPYDRKSLALPFDSGGALSLRNVVASQSFEAPLERARSALVRYQRIKEFEAGVAPAAGPQESAAGAKGLGGGAAGAALDNAAIIEMVAAGLEEQIILTAIDAAPQAAFDVSPAGLIELSRAGVGTKVIQRLQAAAKKTTAAKRSTSPR